jgi:DNA-directed RNA polymerase specialized sigma24 family protein/CheY-like chemotaxis protein
MSRSQLVAEHLPLLRRYARALTGNQASGDAYVGAMLEALLQDASLLDEQHGPRAGLFRLFTQIWNSVSLNDDSDVTTLPMPSERRLSNITPLPRQAFLLLSLEGFSEEEVAFILDIDVAETRKLADTAGREMAAEIATDVLIIEDETFIAMDLESLVKNLGHNVIGVARTHSDAVALAKNKKPGLILADIQLADGSSGLDAVNELLRIFEVPVVFITAYPERFLTGERPEPAFLISKPFQPAMVSAVASQALFFQRNSRNRAPDKSGPPDGAPGFFCDDSRMPLQAASAVSQPESHVSPRSLRSTAKVCPTSRSPLGWAALLIRSGITSARSTASSA